MNIKENSLKPCAKALGDYSCSDEVLIWVEFVLPAHHVVPDFVQLQLVPQEPADASEALAELEAIRRLISDKLNLDAVLLVVKAQPVSQLLATHRLEVNSRFFVFKVLRVLLLLRVEQKDVGYSSNRVFDFVAVDFYVFV